MKNIAFVTYNNMGDDLAAGWHEREGRRALVLINSKGRRSAADQSDRWSASQAGAVTREVTDLWDELDRALPELDHVIVYVGASGSEEAIRRAAGLPASKVTFVLCDCGLPAKEWLLRSQGMGIAERILCECGGRQTMRALYESFMRSGQL